MSDARYVGDRAGMELVDWAFKQKIRDNFTEFCKPWAPKQEGLSDATAKDIMVYLAKYGGRIEVEGLGAFFVRDIAAKPIVDPLGNLVRTRAARRIVDFKMSTRLRDLLNLDYYNQPEPLPNPEYFERSRNLLI